MKKETVGLMIAFVILVFLGATDFYFLSKEQKNNINEKTYGQVFEENVGFENEQLENTIIDYLLDQKEFSWKTARGSKNFCVIENLDPESEISPFYVWARCGEFIIRDAKLKELSGSSGPVKINYPNELSFYDIDKFTHVVPRDGSYYTKDIKEIFPEEARKRIFNYQSEGINIASWKIELKTLKWFSSGEVKGTDNLWEIVVQYIKNCEVERIFQNHSRVVKITLKNGEEMEAIEPEIDEVFEIVQNPKILETCGEVIMITE